jgi:hypothetical protein
MLHLFYSVVRCFHLTKSGGGVPIVTRSKTAKNLHGRFKKQRNLQRISGKLSGKYQSENFLHVRKPYN